MFSLEASLQTAVRTRHRWTQPGAAPYRGRQRPAYAPPHVWYALRAEDARVYPMFRIGRAARGLGPEDASGSLWLLDPAGRARHVRAGHFTRKHPGTQEPGGLRLVAGSRIVSAFLIDSQWQLAAGGRVWPGPLMNDGERITTTLDRLRFWVEQSGIL